MGTKMKIKAILLGLTLAFTSTSSMALLRYVTSTQNTLINFTTDQSGIIFTTAYTGDSPCDRGYGTEYRIHISHPNYKALASTLLAISLDPENSPFTFTYQRRNYQNLPTYECSRIESISRWIGE